MSLSEIFAACLLRSEPDRRQITLTLVGGHSFKGLPFAIEGECWVLEAERDRTWIEAEKVVAITLHGEVPKKVDEPETELALRRHAAGLELGAKVEFIWTAKPPGASEVVAAWRMLQAIGEALKWFPDDASRIGLIRLEAANAGRFRVGEGVLEAGFIEGEAPPAVRELQSLLAAIL